MEFIADLIKLLTPASPFVVLAIVVIYGMRSMDKHSSALRAVTETNQQIAITLAMVNTNHHTMVNRMEDIVDRSQSVIDEIARLRVDLDKHMVAVNVRFNELPAQVQQAVIGEWLKYAQNGHSAQRRGLFARLFT